MPFGAKGLFAEKCLNGHEDAVSLLGRKVAEAINQLRFCGIEVIGGGRLDFSADIGSTDEEINGRFEIICQKFQGSKVGFYGSVFIFSNHWLSESEKIGDCFLTKSAFFPEQF